MASFAQLDSNNIVEGVIEVSSDDMKDDYGNIYENIGVAFCQKALGGGTNWKQSSLASDINDKFRGNPAGVGYTYMTDVQTVGVAKTDIFIEQQPYPSWSIGINTARWYPPANPGPAPIPPESDRGNGKYYVWSESNYNSDPSTAWVLT